jgi:dihydrolipoamide dehydrogenase
MQGIAFLAPNKRRLHMTKAQLIILGGGPAGYRAAERAAAAGLKTIVAEQRALGGVCLNEGCVPSKTLLHSAKVLDTVKSAGTYGVTAGETALDHSKVLARKSRVVKMLTGGVAKSLESAGATVIQGPARLERKQGEDFLVRIGEGLYAASRILVAAGSVPAIPPIPGLGQALESGFAITSREALSLPQVPEELVVIGAGVIGLELACYYKAAGSKVTVLEMLPRIAAGMDADISQMLLAQLKKKGIAFRLGCRVTQVGEGSLTYEVDGQEQELSAHKVLLAGGRVPAVEGLGLETVGLCPGAKGQLETDEQMRTAVPGIWAAGDVNGRSLLAHTAYREAETAVNDMLGIADRMCYHAIPAVLYTSPEAAGIGLTEQSAREQGMDIQTASLSLRYSGRFLAEVQGGDGICKVIADGKGERLLGVHLLGSYASELISGVAPLIESGMKIADIQKVAYAHPTVGELLRDALFALK